MGTGETINGAYKVIMVVPAVSLCHLPTLRRVSAIYQFEIGVERGTDNFVRNVIINHIIKFRFFSKVIRH